MNWQVFTELSSLHVQIHWMAALASAVIGISIFVRTKGTKVHRFMGRLYAVLMVITAVSAFFVRRVDPGETYSLLTNFSFIHLLIPLTLHSLYMAIRAIRKGDIATHKKNMIYTYIGGIVIAGAFTFLPGRHMHSVFFGDPVEIQQRIDSGYKH